MTKDQVRVLTCKISNYKKENSFALSYYSLKLDTNNKGNFIINDNYWSVKNNNVKLLSDHISSYKNITSINLQNQNIGSTGLKILNDALKINPKIYHLDLRSNKIDSGIDDLFCTIKEYLKDLKILLLGGNPIKDQGVEGILKYLGKTNIIKLDLHYCFITTEYAVKLIESAPESLEKLDLSYNKIFVDNLPKAQNIKYLNISNNQKGESMLNNSEENIICPARDPGRNIIGSNNYNDSIDELIKSPFSLEIFNSTD